MARIRLDLPETFQFSFFDNVRISDINYAGHMGNDAFLSLLHEARVQFYNHYGWTELNLAGVGTIMADSVLVYKGEGFHGDELLVEVTAAELGKWGFDLYYRITNRSSGKLLLEAKTGILCFDYSARKLAPLPATAMEKLQSSVS
jgi:acyl-CoA thioester hydrolase